MKKNALILVDLQNDFVPGGALAVPEGDHIIDVANRLQGHFDLVIATQDWHPAGHRSFAANHPGLKPGDIVQLGGLPQVLWPVHCVQNTRGADFVPGLICTDWDRVFQKGMDPAIDSYSGFFDNGRKRTTGLDVYLEEKGVTAVYVMGLATDYCVKFTALDARAAGFETHLIEDACRGVDLAPGDVQRAVRQMRQAGINIIRSADILGDDIKNEEEGEPCLR